MMSTVRPRPIGRWMSGDVLSLLYCIEGAILCPKSIRYAGVASPYTGKLPTCYGLVTVLPGGECQIFLRPWARRLCGRLPRPPPMCDKQSDRVVVAGDGHVCVSVV